MFWGYFYFNLVLIFRFGIPP